MTNSSTLAQTLILCSWKRTWGPHMIVPFRSFHLMDNIQLFRERLSEEVHVTIAKGIVGDSEFTVLQRSLKVWYGRPWTYVCECWRKELKKVRQLPCQGQCINHILFYLLGLCRAHFFRQKCAVYCIAEHFTLISPLSLQWNASHSDSLLAKVARLTTKALHEYLMGMYLALPMKLATYAAHACLRMAGVFGSAI